MSWENGVCIGYKKLFKQTLFRGEETMTGEGLPLSPDLSFCEEEIKRDVLLRGEKRF